MQSFTHAKRAMGVGLVSADRQHDGAIRVRRIWVTYPPPFAAALVLQSLFSLNKLF